MQYSVVILETDMTTETNKKRGRPSECREEARAKGAKWGKNCWGGGGWGGLQHQEHFWGL